MIKVSKDGTVTRDGEMIGRVEKKVLSSGLYETVMGVSATSGGKVQWYAFDAAGEPLNQYGDDTRKRAVSRVERNAEPLKVSDMKLETGLGTTGKCISAGVSWQGHYAGVSRYPSETNWIIDFWSPAGSIMPTFANGTGTRHTTAYALKGEQAAAATAEAIRLGLLAPVEMGVQA